MKLQIQPLTTLCDERINIRISDLPPFGKVKTSASMSFPWAKSVEYESDACFTADSSGNLDLSKQGPDSGSYDFIDSMGLILSLKRVCQICLALFICKYHELLYTEQAVWICLHVPKEPGNCQ
jgi:hypothetical protein